LAPVLQGTKPPAAIATATAITATATHSANATATDEYRASYAASGHRCAIRIRKAAPLWLPVVTLSYLAQESSGCEVRDEDLIQCNLRILITGVLGEGVMKHA